MRESADVVIIIIAFALFGYTHSILASRKIKELAVKKFGDLIAFYRLVYNLLSFISIYILYEAIPKPILVIYDLPSPWDLIIIIPQLAALAGFIWSTMYFDLGDFTGISQVLKWVKGKYNKDELDEKLTFKEEGPYRYMRHPVYFFSIMFLLFRPIMDLFYLTLLLCITAYFYIGSVYEEKKLLEEFGENYAAYQLRVPRIIPLKLRIK